MSTFPEEILRFIREHHVLTLATCDASVPYCSNMFYAYTDNCFFFTSSEKTRHIEEALQNATVAGSIVLETEVIGKIQGLQFCAKFRKPTGLMWAKATAIYLKRFPYAILKGASIWQLEITYAKLTDNRLGFGKKIIWEK